MKPIHKHPLEKCVSVGRFFDYKWYCYKCKKFIEGDDIR